MLHCSAVPVDLLDCLTGLQDSLRTTGFSLAGGTSLALRFGHRLSIDLDFFSLDRFEPGILAQDLGIIPGAITGQAEGTLQLNLHGIKVEFLAHAYPKIAAEETLDGIRMWALEDVAAMKLNAVANRGSKKDFHDICALLDHWPLTALLEFYQEKYRPGSMMMVIRSLAWFEDADGEPDPVSLTGTTWEEVKNQIRSAVQGLE